MKGNNWVVLWLLSTFSLVASNVSINKNKGLTKEQQRQIRSSELYHAKEAKELKMYLLSHGLVSPAGMSDKPPTKELHESAPKPPMAGVEGVKQVEDKKLAAANQMSTQVEEPNADSQPIDESKPALENQLINEKKPTVENQPINENKLVAENQPTEEESKSEGSVKPIEDIKQVSDNKPINQSEPNTLSSDNIQPAKEIKPDDAKPSVDEVKSVETKPVGDSNPTNQLELNAQSSGNIQPANVIKPDDAKPSVNEVKPVSDNKPVNQSEPNTLSSDNIQPAKEIKPNDAKPSIDEVKPVEETKPVGDSKPINQPEPNSQSFGNNQPANEIKPDDAKPSVNEVKPVSDNKPINQPALNTQTFDNVQPAKEIKPDDAKPSVNEDKPIEEAKPVGDSKPISLSEPNNQPSDIIQPAKEIKPESGPNPLNELKPEGITNPSSEPKPEGENHPIGDSKPVIETPSIKAPSKNQPELNNLSTESKPGVNSNPANENKPSEDAKPVLEETKPGAASDNSKPVVEIKPESSSQPIKQGDNKPPVEANPTTEIKPATEPISENKPVTENELSVNNQPVKENAPEGAGIPSSESKPVSDNQPEVNNHSSGESKPITESKPSNNNPNVEHKPSDESKPVTNNKPFGKEQENKPVIDAKPNNGPESPASPETTVSSVEASKQESKNQSEANKPAASYFDTPKPEPLSVEMVVKPSNNQPIPFYQEPSTYDSSKFVPYTAVSDKVVVGYYADWKARDMPPEKIPFDKLTHINYAFAVIKEVNDEPHFETDYLLPKVIKLAHEKKVKVLLSVGGWTGSKYFSPIAADAGRRTTLVKKLVNMTAKFDLDGIDIDWEFPGRMGMVCNQINTAVDSTNFGLMLKELRGAMDSQFTAPDQRKQITLAVRVEPVDGPSGPLKDVSDIVASVDFINVMAYDINGPWGSLTGPNAPLRHRAGKGFQLSYMSGIQSWLEAKFPSDKLVMGLAFYGRSFQLKDDFKPFGSDAFYVPFSNTVSKGDQDDAMWSDPCPGAAYTYSGVWQWKNLRSQSLLTSPLKSGSGWVRHYDSITHTPWLHNPQTKTLINYDDPESLSHKVNLAKCYNLRGVMAWALHEDNLELLNSVQSIRSSEPSTRNLCESYNQLDRMESRAAKLNRTIIDPYPFKQGSLGAISGITRHAPAQRFRKLPIPDIVAAM